MKKNSSDKGKVGESYASLLLKKNGYKIVNKNFRSRFGEIDIVAEKDGYTYFCEVKTRWGVSFGHPEEAVNKLKLDKIKKTIDYYLQQKSGSYTSARILVIAQIINNGSLAYQKLIIVD
ncbi:MAG: TIGR00252 family protein [Candidatus Woesebacteria bacterium GW2011_GWA1_39_21]|uniref:UPF0102 protein UT39_C0006G0036 n=1 Tax=Candidatus Woesebacteria bacterium GW2011_GWA1_39_21 TaxID=1618550 RepID=A0A0G0QMB3_9BACT|nr:MAG: TIGR00252 family protein [Candidatus Woesebacteria bacterium GW2011_GWA1_39_21]